MIIIRTLRRDIAKYNMADDDIEESIEETGWKLVHGDVFRPPFNNRLFAAVIGSGIQVTVRHHASSHAPPDLLHDGDNDLLCHVGYAQSCLQGRAPHSLHLPVSLILVLFPGVTPVISNSWLRYEFMGLVAGYYSGRLYKTMKGKEWKVS